MKHKRQRLIGLMTAFLLVLSGCQLAEEEALATERDVLIGGVVTLGTPGDTIKSGSASSSPGETQNPAGSEQRIYATKETQTYYDETTNETVEREVYGFPEVEGVFFSYELERDEGQELVTVKSAPNKGFWDGGVTYNITNDGSPKGIRTAELRGTVYYSAELGEPIVTLTPVYRTPEGEVYLSMGGTSFQGDGMTACVGEFYTIETQGAETTEEINLYVTAKSRCPAQRIILVQMDNQDRVVTRQDFLPGQLPETLVPEEATSYLLIEACYTDDQGKETVERELVGSTEEYLYTPYRMDNGFFAAQPTRILWKKG